MSSAPNINRAERANRLSTPSVASKGTERTERAELCAKQLGALSVASQRAEPAKRTERGEHAGRISDEERAQRVQQNSATGALTETNNCDRAQQKGATSSSRRRTWAMSSTDERYRLNGRAQPARQRQKTNKGALPATHQRNRRAAQTLRLSLMGTNDAVDERDTQDGSLMPTRMGKRTT